MTGLALEVGGTRFTNYKELSVSRAIDNFSGQFRFEATSNDETAFPVSEGDTVRVVILGAYEGNIHFRGLWSG